MYIIASFWILILVIKRIYGHCRPYSKVLKNFCYYYSYIWRQRKKTCFVIRFRYTLRSSMVELFVVTYRFLQMSNLTTQKNNNEAKTILLHTRRKLNVHKAFLCTSNLWPNSRGYIHGRCSSVFNANFEQVRTSTNPLRICKGNKSVLWENANLNYGSHQTNVLDVFFESNLLFNVCFFLSNFQGRVKHEMMISQNIAKSHVNL